MTIADVIATIAEMKPHAFPDSKIVKWLSDLDALIYKEVISLHENTAITTAYDDDGVLITDMPDPTPYEMVAPETEGGDETVPDVTLIVPEPYSELYVLYVAAQMDFWYGDIVRHNNNMMAYNNAYDGFLRWYHNKHKSKPLPRLEV